MYIELKPEYEQALVSRIAGGDQSACAELYDLLQQGIRFYLLRRGAGEEVNDLVHDVFIRTITGIQNGNRPDRLLGYILGVTKHVASDRLSHVMEERLHRPVLSNTAVTVHTPESLRLQKERSGLLRATLDSMSERDRELLTRFYVMEQTPPDICDAMHLTVDQFRILKSRAKKRLMNRANRALRPTRLGVMARLKSTLCNSMTHRRTVKTRTTVASDNV